MLKLWFFVLIILKLLLSVAWWWFIFCQACCQILSLILFFILQHLLYVNRPLLLSISLVKEPGYIKNIIFWRRISHHQVVICSCYFLIHSSSSCSRWGINAVVYYMILFFLFLQGQSQCFGFFSLLIFFILVLILGVSSSYYFKGIPSIFRSYTVFGHWNNKYLSHYYLSVIMRIAHIEGVPIIYYLLFLLSSSSSPSMSSCWFFFWLRCYPFVIYTQNAFQLHFNHLIILFFGRFLIFISIIIALYQFYIAVNLFLYVVFLRMLTWLLLHCCCYYYFCCNRRHLLFKFYII